MIYVVAVDRECAARRPRGPDLLDGVRLRWREAWRSGHQIVILAAEGYSSAEIVCRMGCPSRGWSLGSVGTPPRAWQVWTTAPSPASSRNSHRRGPDRRPDAEGHRPSGSGWRTDRAGRWPPGSACRTWRSSRSGGSGTCGPGGPRPSSSPPTLKARLPSRAWAPRRTTRMTNARQSGRTAAPGAQPADPEDRRHLGGGHPTALDRLV